MSSTVRLALDSTRQQGRLRWPKCCAVCARQDSGLQAARLRSPRLKTTPPSLRGGVSLQGRRLQLGPPLCPRHARRQRWAALVLYPSALAAALRALTVLALPLAALLALNALAPLLPPGDPLAQALPGPHSPLTWALAAWGLLGSALMLWAQRHAGVRILSASPQALTLRFANTRYADAFRRANAGATSAQPPRRRRPQALLLAAALALLAAALWQRLA